MSDRGEGFDHTRGHEHYIREEWQIAFDQVGRGEVADLDMKALLAEAHRRYGAPVMNPESPPSP